MHIQTFIYLPYPGVFWVTKYESLSLRCYMIVVFSTDLQLPLPNTTDHHDTTEILLTLTLNTITYITPDKDSILLVFYTISISNDGMVV